MGTQSIALITLVLGLCGTFIIQIIKKLSKTNGNKAFNIAVVVSIILGLLASWFTGEITGISKVESVSVIFTVSTVVYNWFVKNLSINQ